MNGPLTKTHIGVKEAIARISQAHVIALVLPDEVDVAIAGSALALFISLRQRDKIITLFAPDTLPLQEFLPPNAPGDDNEPLREFILSFDLSRSPIKELKYIRDTNRLNIILSPTGRLRKEDVEFRAGPLLYDLIITLGVRSPEDTAHTMRRAPELLYEKPILNIDARRDNTAFGEMNLREEGGGPRTLPELIYGILTGVEARPDDPEVASLLLTALAYATKNFRPHRTSAAAFRIAGELMQRGGDIARIARRLIAENALAEEQLAARALVRSRYLARNDFLCSLLTLEDFATTRTTPRSVFFVLDRINASFPGVKYSILLWHSPEDEKVHCSIALTDPSPEEKLLPHGIYSHENSALTLHDSYASFSEAEAAIIQLLRHTNAVE